MASRTILPAKLTRPSATGLLARERLFRSLDAMRADRCIWISGPAGAGKTSLVSSWLETNKHKTAWYQVDAGDEDAATFFHYLHLLSKTITRRRLELQHLTPEYLPALDVFVRRFFEDFFALFKGPFVLVFDNCHDVRAESSFPMILGGALSALPLDGLIICISREEPPPGLARWSVDHKFNHIGWDDLRFDDEEARALAGRAGEYDQATLSALNAETRGWAAGLRLLLRARTVGLEVDAGSARTTQALFDYFATEIFNKMTSGMRDFLLRTSLLPEVTPQLAQQISGYDKAADTLAWLHRNRLFTERRLQVHAEPSYEFHPLFREFLLEHARAQLPAAEFAELQKQAASLLEESGRMDEAAALWRSAQDWQALQRLILRQAPALMMQVRIATLEEWILALPESLREEAAWTLYWLGVCRSLHDPPLARTSLKQAYQRFRAEGDSAGSFLAVSSLIGSYFLVFDLAEPLDRWIGEFESLLKENDGVIPAAVEVQVLGSLQGIMFRCPDHPMLRPLAERAETLARTLPEPSQRLIVAPLAIQYFTWSGHVSRAHLLCDELAGAISPDVPIFAKISFSIWRGILFTARAEFDAANAAFNAALELAQSLGSSVFHSVIWAQLAVVALGEGRAEEAQRLLDAGGPLLDPRNLVYAQFYQIMRAATLSLRGRNRDAVALAQEAARPEIGCGAPYPAACYRLVFGQILMLDGQHAEARVQLYHAAEYGRRMPSDSVLFPALMDLAWLDLEAGDDAAATSLLREALGIAARQNYKYCAPLWIPSVLSRLCAQALEDNIEVDYVRSLIQLHKLAPPADHRDVEGWPWPVRIYTLGRFTVLIDNKPLTFSARAQKKPLELLKALISLGGRSVGLSVLTAQVWPDLEGDAAQNACSVALHRLRRLLGGGDVLEMQEGALSLDPQRVWVDAWTFERLASEADKVAQAPIARDSSTVEDLAARTLKLYPGHFLPDEEVPWAIAYRERLRSKFLRTVSVIGARLEGAQRLDEAVDLYRRALEQDPLAETFHRGLMRCLNARGHVAEALEAYRRCRDILSITLGVEPSAETQAVYRGLKG